jgi:hypothetical protein
VTASLDEAYYNFSVDAPASTSTNFYLMVGDNAYSATGFAGDIDAYQLHVDIGSTYTIVATDNTNGFETALGVYNRLGSLLLSSSVDRGGYTELTFTATDTLVYITAQASGVGIYGIRVDNNSVIEANGIGETIYANQTYSAALDYTSDSDHFLFSAVAGHTYKVTITTAIPDLFLKVSALGTSSYTPVTLVGSAGTYTFTAAVTGSFDFSVSANSYTSRGAYSFTTSEVTGGPTVGPGIGGTPQTAPASGGTVTGGASDDWLQGGPGNDILHGGAGSDYLDGGGGVNTALYDGALHQYSFGAGYTQVIGGPEGGTDTLANIQRIQFVDGYLAFAPTDTAGQVYRLYEGTLGRAPDPAGLAAWTHGLNAGVTLLSVAGSLVGSAEFQGTYGALTDSGFVSLLYNNVLHRAADAGGLAYWTGLLAAGHSRAEVVLGFTESNEDIADLATPVQQGLWVQDAAAAQVARLYDTAFSRLPDATGLAYWTHALESGTTLLQVAQGFIASAEFQGPYGALDNTGFVSLLYNNVLHRAPDAGGLAYWVSLLNTGQDSRAQEVVGFSESAEHIGNTAPHIDHGIWVA